MVPDSLVLSIFPGSGRKHTACSTGKRSSDNSSDDDDDDDNNNSNNYYCYWRDQLAS